MHRYCLLVLDTMVYSSEVLAVNVCQNGTHNSQDVIVLVFYACQPAGQLPTTGHCLALYLCGVNSLYSRQLFRQPIVHTEYCSPKVSNVLIFYIEYISCSNTNQ